MLGDVMPLTLNIHHRPDQIVVYKKLPARIDPEGPILHIYGKHQTVARQNAVTLGVQLAVYIGPPRFIRHAVGSLCPGNLSLFRHQHTTQTE